MHTNEFTRPALRGVTAGTRSARPASLRPPLSRPAILLTALGVLAPASPASAAMTKISAVGAYDPNNVQCPAPTGEFEDFVDYDPVFIEGNLYGCLYTKVDWYKDNGAPSGVYLETGREYFIGELDGEWIEFTTDYRFESKWDPDFTTGEEVHGRCQHPISDEFFDDVEGRLDFKDIVETGTFAIRGHIRRS